MSRLENKVAIITGAAGGQGAAEVSMFVNEGAKVVATDIKEVDLTKIVDEVNKNNKDSVLGIQHDVTSEEQWEHVVSEAIKKFGKIDILVNNAGIGGVEGFASMEDINLNSWNKYMNINATGSFLGINKVFPEMKKQKSGSIINTSSAAGIIGGAAGIQYTASKGANRLLAKGVAIELAQYNIRANSVHPGFIDTPMVSSVTEDKEAKNAALAQIPMGFVGKPNDVAYAVLFLASDESRYVTGTELIVDGGYISS